MRYLIIILFEVILLHPILGQKPELKFNADNKFKIVQFTDTHIIAGDTNSFASIRTIATILETEQPDLVVFTGDVVIESQLEQGWNMVTQPVITREIPFAVVFGNHDDEYYLSRQQLSDIIEKMPFSLFVSKVGNITGYGNYVVPIQSSSKEKDTALLYFIDSNAYAKKPNKGYDWIQPDQIEWYKQESERYEKSNRGKVLPALAFFHIPLPEFYEAYINEAHLPIGLRLEKECAPEFNSGMFQAMEKRGDIMGVFTGHDHDNDYIAYLRGIALAYGRFTGSKTTYGVLSNGGRVIELTQGERSFKTWIRTGSNQVFCSVKFPDDFLNKNNK